MDKENQKLQEELLKLCDLQEKGKSEKINIDKKVFEPCIEEEIDYYFPTKSANAVQTYSTITEFPCCPDSLIDNSLENYLQNLIRIQHLLHLFHY